MSQEYHIYGLACPITNQLHYIGYTKNMESRLAAHISSARREYSDNEKDIWINYLLTKKTKPDMFMIQEVDDINKLDTELFWIEYFKMVGADLFNTVGMKKKIRDHFTPKTTMIKPLREKLGLTQGQLARKIKTTKKVVSMWENDKVYFASDITIKLFTNLYRKSILDEKYNN